MACSKLTSDGDPSVYVRTDYQSCLGDDFLQIGILLGNTYVKQGDLVTEEYYHYMKLEAIRVKTVAGGGLSSKLADVLSTQDNFFTELKNSIAGLKSASTVKSGLGVARRAVRVGRIPVPDAPGYDEGEENDLAWKRYQWLFMADGKSKARAQFKLDFKGLLKTINPKGAKKSDVEKFANSIKKKALVAKKEEEAKEQADMLMLAKEAGEGVDNKLSDNIDAAATQTFDMSSEDEDEKEDEGGDGPASGGGASEEKDTTILGKRACPSGAVRTNQTIVLQQRESVAELNARVNEYQAFIVAKNLQELFAKFQSQRTADMELDEEQHEQDEDEELETEAYDGEMEGTE